MLILVFLIYCTRMFIKLLYEFTNNCYLLKQYLKKKKKITNIYCSIMLTCFITDRYKHNNIISKNTRNKYHIGIILYYIRLYY